jgi:arginase family enzyme
VDYPKSMSAAAQLNLDEAWPREASGLPLVDAQDWGPQLRFSAPSRLVENFYREYQDRVAPFVIYGSGDFHYLTALWVRRVQQPVVLVSFDNHPDWDIRPPKWACGGWVNRAMELPQLQKVSVWGCGNFECWFPHQIFGNRRAERAGKLEVHPWADERPAKDRQRRGAILRDNWAVQFEEFVRNLGGANVYVTIDIDCLRPEEAVTNWENGRFTVTDLVWALDKLREHCRVVAGDICGAYSQPTYARWKQRFASEFDHPKLRRPGTDDIQRINVTTLQKLFPALQEGAAA